MCNGYQDFLTNARTTLVVEVAETRETLLAACTRYQIAFATLRQHALAHDTSAYRLIAGVCLRKVFEYQYD